MLLTGNFSFVSLSRTDFTDTKTGEKKLFHYVNLLTSDGSVSRLNVSQQLYEELGVCVLGDSLTGVIDLRYNTERGWGVRVSSLTPSTSMI